jgi:hypothetical protein
MKIIISESQELDVKKKFIFMLLNNKNYNLVEIGDNIYFVKKRGDKKAEIRYNKSDGWCGISDKLIVFLSTITGFSWSDVKTLIGYWVEHVLQMEVKYNWPPASHSLNIPYK